MRFKKSIFVLELRYLRNYYSEFKKIKYLFIVVDTWNRQFNTKIFIIMLLCNLIRFLFNNAILLQD